MYGLSQGKVFNPPGHSYFERLLKPVLLLKKMYVILQCVFSHYHFFLISVLSHILRVFFFVCTLLVCKFRKGVLLELIMELRDNQYTCALFLKNFRGDMLKGSCENLKMNT